MMKMKKNLTKNKIYQGLQKRRKAIKARAFLMAGFLLVINSFAWFVFVANGNGQINADVIAWDIVFLDEDSQVEFVEIKLTDLFPGMDPYTKEITIRNQSDLSANFTYEVEELYAFGKKYENEDLVTFLAEDFPFSITFSHDKDILETGEQLKFTINVDWPFEASEQYYKLNDLYNFVNGITYYGYNDEVGYYEESVTGDSFYDLIKDGLWVESDDADTYWGEESMLFKQEYPEESALYLKLKLIVTQNPTA